MIREKVILVAVFIAVYFAGLLSGYDIRKSEAPASFNAKPARVIQA